MQGPENDARSGVQWNTGTGYLCVSHPEQRTDQVCQACGRPFCASCLTELLGKSYCGWCRDLRLAQLSGADGASTVNPQDVVRWARMLSWFNFGCTAISGVSLLAFSTMLYASFFPLMQAFNGGSGTLDFWSASLLIGAGVVQILMGALLYVPPAVGLGPGRGWAWMWNTVALILTVLSTAGSSMLLGVAGMCAMPGLVLSILMLIYWFRPEVRAYCEHG